jgi:YrbI family 3-deoxy-D-manno-octulosonate 8-phosphate phosphatase
MNQEFIKKISKIKIFITDFDGIHTNGYVYVDEFGRESVKCSRKDGLAYDFLKKMGIISYIISKEKNPVVSMRAKKLGVDYYFGVSSSESKKNIIIKLLKKHKVNSSDVLYMGDDINDIEPIKFVGVPVTVSDAHKIIKKHSMYITKSKGGEHAIREVVSILMKTKKYEESV